MEPGKKLTIGLFGFGVVGKGLYDVLHNTATLQSTIKKICIKNTEKKRSIGQELFTSEASELLNDEEINVIVELIDEVIVNKENAVVIENVKKKVNALMSDLPLYAW